MLKKSQNITVSGTSQTEDGQIIGYFTANLADDGTASTSATIADRELYSDNIAAYKADRNEFSVYVDSLVDG